MKKIILLIIVMLSLAGISFSQAKIIKATKQKTYGGMGGSFMTYTIGYNNTGADSIIIDSVETIADSLGIPFFFNQTEKPYRELYFGYTFSPAEKCKTCRDTIAKPYNMTKGVIVYYRAGMKKHFFKVKKFKDLPVRKAA
jgi:hypothetical protein